MRPRTTHLFTRLCTNPESRKDQFRVRAEPRRPMLSVPVLHLWFHGNSRLLPRPPRLGARRIRDARGNNPFPRPPGVPVAPVVNEKDPENALLDVFATLSRVGGCLSLHRRQWQTIGAEPWVALGRIPHPLSGSSSTPRQIPGIISNVPNRLLPSSRPSTGGREHGGKRSSGNRS